VVLAGVTASVRTIPMLRVATAVWIIGASCLFVWSFHVAEKSGVLATPGGRLFAIGTATLAAAFFAYSGLTVIFVVSEAVGFPH